MLTFGDFDHRLLWLGDLSRRLFTFDDFGSCAVISTQVKALKRSCLL